MRNLLALLLIVAAISPPLAAQVAIDSFPKLHPSQDWPWWRGGSRDGHATGQSVPSELNESINLDWSQPIPGRGHGSPIVVGNRVFLLSADEQEKRHSVIAFDRDTGQAVWQMELNQGGFPEKNHPKNTEASPTLACDGEALFAALYHHDAIWLSSISLDGEKLWEKSLGRYRPSLYQYGYAASPVLYGDLVIVASEYDGPSALVGLKRSDGSEVWRTSRASMITFSSPVVTSFNGKDYLLISGGNLVTAYDPANGNLLWSTPGTALATCGTMVWDQGIVYASGGYPASETIALNIENGGVIWRNRQKAYEQSMVAANGFLYSYADGGILYCWNGKTGEEMWKQRLGSRISASGVLVGDRIYWANEQGILYVFRASPERYVQIASNEIGDEAFASPAICGNQIFLRIAKAEGAGRQEYLLRFSNR